MRRQSRPPFVLCNDENFPVSYGDDHGNSSSDHVYCGRIGSNGIRCGPLQDDGSLPCASCQRFDNYASQKQQQQKPYIALMLSHALETCNELQEALPEVQRLALRESIYAASSNTIALDIALSNLVPPSQEATTTTTTNNDNNYAIITSEQFQNILLEEVNDSPYIPTRATTTRNTMTQAIVNKDWDYLKQLADMMDELYIFKPPNDLYHRSKEENLESYRSMVVELFTSSQKLMRLGNLSIAQLQLIHLSDAMYTIPSISELKQLALQSLERSSMIFSDREMELVQKDLLEDRYDLLLQADRFDCVLHGNNTGNNSTSARSNSTAATTTTTTTIAATGAVATSARPRRNNNHASLRSAVSLGTGDIIVPPYHDNDEFFQDVVVGDIRPFIVTSDEDEDGDDNNDDSSGEDYYSLAASSSVVIDDSEVGALDQEEVAVEEPAVVVEEETKKNCPICLGANEADSALPCAHVFCSGCLAHWISRHDGDQFPCPVCRFMTSVSY